MLLAWALLLLQPPDTNEPRRGVNRLFGLPCAQLDLECLRSSFQQWYADPYHFYAKQRDRWIIVPPLFGLRFGEGATTPADSLAARLQSLWSDEATPLADRRARLFQLWDDCDEDTRAGRDARQQIERFIREAAPRGTPRAYPQAQLRELNRKRTSNTKFAPYD